MHGSSQAVCQRVFLLKALLVISCTVQGVLNGDMVVSSSSVGYRYLPESEIGMGPGYGQLMPLLKHLVQLVGKSGGDDFSPDDDSEGTCTTLCCGS